MGQGVILKAISGFYTVLDGEEKITCKARGKFRHEKVTPLVGDCVEYTRQEGDKGTVDAILPRKNQFDRPAVANIDQLVIIVSEAVPVTDPFLIDRMTCIAERQQCVPVICVNKCDLAPGEKLAALYRSVGYPVVRVSAATGEGIPELSALLVGKISAFTGNTGVGKSSILNALEPDFSLQTGEVSDKLGRGRHTTRHVELFRLSSGAIAADTPGFSSFDTDAAALWRKEELENYFPEFRPYLGKCRFTGCAHGKEQGCAVLEALREEKIPPSRHESYLTLYEQAKLVKDWQRKE